MRRLPLLLAAALVTAAPALACDKLSRTVDFLGWTEDGQLFAWKVQETCVGCSPKWVLEHVYVSTLNGRTTEYVTRWEKSPYPRPDEPGQAELDAWLKRYPLTKKGGTVPVAAAQKGVAVKAGKGLEFCPKAEGEVEFTAGKNKRTWRAPPTPACGCVRAFPNASGQAVAFVTGPAKRVCDDCHGAPCCGEAEAFAIYAE